MMRNRFRVEVVPDTNSMADLETPSALLSTATIALLALPFSVLR